MPLKQPALMTNAEPRSESPGLRRRLTSRLTTRRLGLERSFSLPFVKREDRSKIYPNMCSRCKFQLDYLNEKQKTGYERITCKFCGHVFKVGTIR